MRIWWCTNRSAGCLRSYSMERIESFAPVAGPDARILILGTMPSCESLRQNFYYAHPRNAFWPIMAQLFGEAPPESVAQKKKLLLDHRVALWDVAHSCVRPGSLDSAIRDAVANDFPALFARCPGIEKVLFNGATAEKLYWKLVGDLPEGCRWARMPSTSPAYTLAYAKKLAAWRDGMEGYL